MNTSKQVNVMIGLLFIAFLVFGAYILDEGHRAEAARAEQDALMAERGATLFVTNCRTCHGLQGQGVDEGGIAPKLNSAAYLVLAPDNPFGLPATPDGDARNIREFLFNTIACGRTNTPMPTWSEHYGGPLSDVQINYIVSMITQGRWDLVQKIGEEHDQATDPPTTAKDILVSDPAALSITTKNCGQYTGASAKEYRDRNPFVTGGAAAAAPAATASPAAGGAAPAPGTGAGVAVALKEWSVTPNPAQGSAGAIEFDVKNAGAVPHEFVVVKTDTPADKLEQKGGTVDESKVQVIGRIDAFGGGEEKKLAVTLQPGNYALLCNVVGHYQLGMHAAFAVK